MHPIIWLYNNSDPDLNEALTVFATPGASFLPANGARKVRLRVSLSDLMQSFIRLGNLGIHQKPTVEMIQWTGLRENLQDTIDFPSKYGVFL
jgi:hypothetical protein